MKTASGGTLVTNQPHPAMAPGTVLSWCQSRVLVGLLLTFFFLLTMVTGCQAPLPQEISPVTFTTLPASKAAQLSDDGDKEPLLQALAASLAYWQKQDPARVVEACGESYHVKDFSLSLEKFQTLLTETAANQLMTAVADTFTFCQIQPRQGEGKLLVTGYYQPRFLASRVRRPPFLYPVYGPPADLLQAQVFTDKESKEIGRLADDRLVPYWTRSEIETKDLLHGSELCFLADPVDVFILQVQGSGLVQFEDGELKQLLFAGSNGREYRSIGRLLADEGRIPLAEITMPRIRQYLHEHLDERQRILHYNERYVFFRLEEHGPGPIGSMGAVLTPERSVALDLSAFPQGGLYFLSSARPTEKITTPQSWQPLNRFVLHQDTGTAIKGYGRLDFFWGSGEYPERAAGLMKQPGTLYLLMQKHPEP
ncbi:MAG: MltA domain-containing protein [Desulfobulbaceae bacterium]|nr:MltA domain-containing protein [Desulfobulbaceae bacterium]